MSGKKRPAQPDAQQEQLLAEAKQMVNGQAWQMKRALDQNDIMEALKHASNMISELRTGLLTPRSYYALYLLTTGHLRQLEYYIAEGRHGRQLHELYELVQYAGNILPRLYLLTTVGSVFMKSLQVPAKEVLYDLVELCRGVQHPTRGLFLRTYLSEMTKDTLPDEGLKFTGDVTDSIDFVITNFTEMNKLWVRMQHGASPSRDQSRKEQEREDLNILVGKNLSRLSQLEGLTIGIYKSDVLPRVLAQIIQCEDRIAQQYLMVILIQAFSDDFHLRTLDQLLTACQSLQEDVEVHTIVSSLIDRIASYCAGKSTATGPDDVPLFDLFSKYINDLTKARTSMSLAAILEMSNAMVNLALRVYPQDNSKLDSVYEFASSHIQERGGCGDDKKVMDQCSRILQSPIEHHKTIRPTLVLKNFGKVLNSLPWGTRRKMAIFFVDSVTKNETKIPSAEEVETLLNYLSPLIKRDGTETFSDDDWHEDQMKVSCIISMFNSTDVETMYAILRKAHDMLRENVNIKGRYTLVPLSFKALKLAQDINRAKSTDEGWEKKAKLVFKFVNDAVTAIKGEEPQLAFNLYLECAIAAGKMGLSVFAYGFLTKGALALYEDETAMSQSQLEFSAVRQLIATIDHLVCFETEEYEKLAKRIAQHASKLVIVDFQSRATVLAAHLFMSGGSGAHEFKDPKSSLQCLKKAMQISTGVTEPEGKTALLVELLDHYLWFFDKYPDVVDNVYVNAIIDKIKKQVVADELDTKGHSCLFHFKNIKDNVVARQNWQTYLVKPPKDKSAQGETPVDVAQVGLNEEKAKAEAERWSQIP